MFSQATDDNWIGRLRTPAERFRREWWWLAALWVTLGGLLVAMLCTQRSDIRSSERQRLALQARTIHDNLGRQLDAVNHALASLIEEMPRWRSQADGMERLGARLRAYSDVMTGVRTLTVLDAQGRVIASSRAELVGESLGHRDYFHAARQAGSADALVVSPPFRTVLGVWALVLARSVPGPDGGFGGVVVATLDAEEFRTLIESVRYAPDMLAALAHGDGQRFLVVPEREGLPQERTAQPDPWLTRHQHSGREASVFLDATGPRGTPRLLAMHTVQPAQLHMDQPLVAVVGRDWHMVFAGWRAQAWALGVAYALAGLAAAAGLHLMQRRRLQSWRHGQALVAQGAALQARWRAVLEATQQGVWDWDLGTGKVYYSPVWKSMLGHAEGEIGDGVDEWQGRVHPDDRERAQAALQSHLRGETPSYEHVYRLRCKDGGYKWVQGRGQVLERGQGGAPLRLIGTHTDVTQAKQQSLQLQETERLLKHLMQEMPIGLCMVDAEGAIYYRNRRFVDLLGYTQADVPTMAQWWCKAYPDPVDRERAMGQWNTALAQAAAGAGDLPDQEYRVTAHDGTLRTIAIGGITFGSHFMATFVDRTEQQAQSERLRTLAYVDGLTGLANRRQFDQTLRTEWRRARRSGRPLALVMLDIDHFKQFNDLYGHQQGDECLRAVAAALRAGLARSHDLVARYGGEEFVCLLPECDLDDARAKAQALCRAVQARGIAHRGSPVAPVVTVSAGVACQVPDADATPEQLLARADANLYRAKAAGRNRVDDGADVLS